MRNIITNESIDYALLNRMVERVGNYSGSKTKILFKCKICDHNWMSRPDVVLPSKHGCPKCANNLPYTNEIIDDKIKYRGILRIGNYIKDKVKILFKCLTCKNEWLTRPDVILRGFGCPHCNSSNGENLIKETIKCKIKFDKMEYQKQIKWNNHRFMVDFYIENNLNKYIVEYNGRQHYQPINMFGGNERFEKQILRDKKLKEYCYQNNIIYVEIDGRKSPNECTDYILKVMENV